MAKFLCVQTYSSTSSESLVYIPDTSLPQLFVCRLAPLLAAWANRLFRSRGMPDKAPVVLFSTDWKTRLASGAAPIRADSGKVCVLGVAPERSPLPNTEPATCVPCPLLTSFAPSPTRS